MDDSFSKANTTDKQPAFLHDAKHLHERREVHEKGIFHANYGGKGFFGSIGQFFKNIKLYFEKNNVSALDKALKEEFAKYSDAFNTTKLTMIKETKMKRLEELQKDLCSIENVLHTMTAQNQLPDSHPLWTNAKQFKQLGTQVTDLYNQIKRENTQRLD